MTLAEIINSPAVVSLLITLALIVINRLFDHRPGWKRKWEKYSPVFIQAVRYAEKAIPDDNPNKALRRADEALKYAIRLLDEHGRRITSADTSDLRLAISATHAELDAAGILADHKAKP